VTPSGVDRDHPEATFLQIAEHRNRERFDALIGPYPGDRGL
jgi:hypothetical protein